MNWLKAYRSISWDIFIKLYPCKADSLLQSYGQFSFQLGKSRLSYCETINAVVDSQFELGRLVLSMGCCMGLQGIPGGPFTCPHSKLCFPYICKLCFAFGLACRCHMHRKTSGVAEARRIPPPSSPPSWLQCHWSVPFPSADPCIPSYPKPWKLPERCQE